MPAPDTKPGPFVPVLFVAIGLGVVGSLMVANGYDTESLFATGEITTVGRIGYVILAVSALIAQYALAGMAAAAALRHWFSQQPLNGR